MFRAISPAVLPYQTQFGLLQSQDSYCLSHLHFNLLLLSFKVHRVSFTVLKIARKMYPSHLCQSSLKIFRNSIDDWTIRFSETCLKNPDLSFICSHKI